MRHQLWGVLVAGVGILGAAGLSSHAVEAAQLAESTSAKAPADTSDTSIVVRTYTQPASAADIQTARRTAGAILERAGIHVVWLECALPGEVTPANACMKSPQANELIVRILSARALDHPLDDDTLGFAIIDLKSGTGSLATVYADRVSLMAQEAGVDDAELLGKAIAHEVGHLLLGTNRHTGRGLMRASWSSADLRQSHPALWLFRGKESDAMRNRIARRSSVGAMTE
jgi:hypothetical protein